MSATKDATTWDLIHRERAVMAGTLSGLSPTDWAAPSHCKGWSVKVAAAHILLGAEQTPGHFMGRMAANGFRFNHMMDTDARRTAERPQHEIIERLQATVTTTNHPPAPVATMLGEIVVHGADIRHAVGAEGTPSPEALVACLEMYVKSGFPVGTKKRIEGLRLVPDGVDWSYGSGPEVTGPAVPMLLAMTGRAAGLRDLSGPGVDIMRSRMPSTS
jgi:uncharacterized protein (TIGR03083 family)